MEFLCRAHIFSVTASAAAVGSTPVPHQRRKCFLGEGVCPTKATKIEPVRIVEGCLWRVHKTSSQGGCGGTVGQERFKINVHRDVREETDYHSSFLFS